jgi:ribosome-binding protein aMBF1 (putative translation factor)
VTWYVYALREPDGGAIRYVGKSCDPSNRLAHHCSPSASRPIRDWVTSLAPRKPELALLFDCAEERLAAEEEIRCIARLRAEGCSLLNRTRGGERTRTSKELRFVGLGKRVRETREAKGWSQRDLGVASGVAHSNISRIESAVVPTTGADIAVLLAVALGVSVEWLVTGEERVEKRGAA